MLLVVGPYSFEIDSYSEDATQVSVDMKGDCKNIKNCFLDATDIQIYDKAGNELAYYFNLTFKSVTAYSDNKVTVIMSFPETSTVDARMSTLEMLIATIEQYIANLDELIAELMFGADDEEGI